MYTHTHGTLCFGEMRDGYVNDAVMLFRHFSVCLNYFLIKLKCKKLGNKILPSTDTVSDLSKHDQEV